MIGVSTESAFANWCNRSSSFATSERLVKSRNRNRMKIAFESYEFQFPVFLTMGDTAGSHSAKTVQLIVRAASG